MVRDSGVLGLYVSAEGAFSLCHAAHATSAEEARTIQRTPDWALNK